MMSAPDLYLSRVNAMKAVLLLLPLLALTSCVHTKPNDSRSGADYSATTGPEKQMPSDPWKGLDKPEVEQRAKHYENQGHSAEEALALAQIEYLKSAP
jgi:hypothetical protein